LILSSREDTPAACHAESGEGGGALPKAVLIFDDPTSARDIRTYLDRAGWDVESFGSKSHALQSLRALAPDVVVADCTARPEAAAELVRDVAAIDPRQKVVLIASETDALDAVNAMRSGAYVYLGQPFVAGELLSLLMRAVSDDREATAPCAPPARPVDRGGLDCLIGDSAPMVTLKSRLRRLAEAEANMRHGDYPSVLITGETGTGKELVARALHVEGPRRNGPFVEINCASLPVNLLESELFGYERGAFTDAKERKVGLVEAAEGGTLFLDEIGEVDPSIQAKLLKLLEERTVRRLGATRERQVNVRIVSATNQDLEKMVREGRFRSDLFFRLRIITLQMPTLSERREDVLLLARHFLALHGSRYGKNQLSLSAEVEDALLAHSWPGNVRELKNVVEQAVLLAREDVICAEDVALCLPSKPACPSLAARSEAAPSSPRSRNAALSRKHVETVIEQANWNVARAARLLGISRDTLRYRIRKYGLAIHMRTAAGAEEA
jgi:two-component system, NtrC family, response regulator AtoC